MAWQPEAESAESGVEVPQDGFNPADVRVLSMLGCGTSGQVYLALHQGQEVAAKVMSLGLHQRREVQILRKLLHPRLVGFLGTVDVGNQCYLLQEFCAGGCLFELLHNCDHIELVWQQQWQCLVDISDAMAYLHSAGIVHRDLKSLNCLLDTPVVSPESQISVKVADFGLGKIKDQSSNDGWGKMTIAAGTCHWMAPEVFQGTSYDERVDIWSYGMLMFEAICREVPYEEEEPASVGVLVVRGQLPDLDAVPPDCPGELLALMLRALSHQPEGRPSFAEIRAELEGVREEVRSASLYFITSWQSRNLATPAACRPHPEQRTSAQARLPEDTLPHPEQRTPVQARLPEDTLSPSEPDAEPCLSEALLLDVRCERPQVAGNRHELLGLVTITCPEREPCLPTRRLGVDLALALDVSGSMNTTSKGHPKIEVLKQAVYFLLGELSSDDRVAIVTFNNAAMERFNFRCMTVDGRGDAETTLRGIAAGGGTAITEGLAVAMDLLRGRRSCNPVSALMLLTDGQNNGPPLDPHLIQEALDRGISVYAFGIGQDHDAEFLGRVATLARTPFAHIEEESCLVGAFAATVAGLLSVRARHVELCIKGLGVTRIQAAHSPFVEEKTPTTARVVLPDLFRGERRDVLLELEAPGVTELLEVTCTFRSLRGPAHLATKKLEIARGEPEAEPDIELVMQRDRIAVARTLDAVLSEAKHKRIAKAHQLLDEALRRPWQPELREELEAARARIGGAALCGAGFASLLDAAQMHSHQRCLFSSPEHLGSGSMYLTNAQHQCIARSL